MSQRIFEISERGTEEVNCRQAQIRPFAAKSMKVLSPGRHHVPGFESSGSLWPSTTLISSSVSPYNSYTNSSICLSVASICLCSVFFVRCVGLLELLVKGEHLIHSISLVWKTFFSSKRARSNHKDHKAQEGCAISKNQIRISIPHIIL